MIMKKIICILLFGWFLVENSLGQAKDSLSNQNPQLEYAILNESGAFTHRLTIYYGNTKQTEKFLKTHP
jgi:hypothetical protein